MDTTAEAYLYAGVRMMSTPDLTNEGWAMLVGNAETGTRGQGSLVEATQRLSVAVDAQTKSSNELGSRVEKLNTRLYVVTVAIFILTGMQVLAALVQAVAAWKALGWGG